MERCPHCGETLTVQHEKCPACGLTIPQADLARLRDPTLPATLAPPPEEPALAQGRILGDRYEILGVLGKGGMGWVYRARDREIDRVLALKVIRRDLAGDDAVIRRFREEIILARKVTHKNVLRIYDIAEAEGIKFISMPYIEGTDLKSMILERGALGIDEAVGLATQVAQALKCAHEAGVVHRDLKPQNILIDNAGTAYVTDFGIAKSVEAGGLTVTGQIIGTPEYMSPEQAEGKDVDYRTDIYSLGLVLYEILTGQVAFKADTIISTLMKRLREHAEPPSKLNPAVPKWLDSLVMKALERDVQDRYQSIDEILADIESQTVKRRPKLTRRMLVLVAALATLGAATAIFLTLRPSLVLHKARIYLAVLPFENLTNGSELEWLASGIPDNLTADLAQSKFFRVMSPERLRDVVHDVGKNLSDVATPEALGAVARATGLDAVALGNFVKSGDRIRITLKIENAHDQEIIGTRIVEGSESDLLTMIDALGTNARQIFNLSQKQIDSDLATGTAPQRTKSVKAAADFAQGVDLSYKGVYLDAAKAFEAAISADPDFAMAYAKAAEAYQNLGYDAKAEQLSFTAVDKVVKFMDRASPADRTFIMAGHANITHNTNQAIQSYRDFIAAYPDDPEGYYKLGLTYASVSQWDPARENFAKAISLDPKFASASFELGKVLINQDNLEQALPELERVQKMYSDMGNREGEAGVLNAIGVIYKRKNEFTKAIEYYEASLKLKEALGDKRGIAATLGNIGLIYEIMGERDEALGALERSLEIRKEIGDKVGISNALNKIGQIYQSDGKFDEALANFDRSYEIRREAGAKELMASSLSDMGSVYSMMGRYGKAVEMDSLALVLRTEIGDARDQAQSLSNIGETLLNRGRLPAARSRFEQALSIDAKLADARSIARDHQALAGYYLSAGKVDSAIVFLSDALKAQQAIGEKPGAALTMSMLGEAELLKGEYKQALGNLDGSSDIAASTGEKEVLATAAATRVRVFSELGYFPAADSALGGAGSQNDAALSYEVRCYLKLAGAERMSAARRYPEARAVCRDVLEAVGKEDVRCRARAMILDANAALAEGKAPDAIATLDTVLQEARQFGLRDLESEGLRLYAACLAGQGKAQEGLARCDEALKIADGLGICDIDYLFACGDVRLAAGDREGASSYYTRALDEVGLIADQKCPRRAREAYLAQREAPRYAGLVADLLEKLGRGAEASTYKARFHLR